MPRIFDKTLRRTYTGSGNTLSQACNNHLVAGYVHNPHDIFFVLPPLALLLDATKSGLLLSKTQLFSRPLHAVHRPYLRPRRV